MSFLALHPSRSSKSLSRTQTQLVTDSGVLPTSLEHEPLSDVDLSPLSSPPPTYRRRLRREKSASPTRGSEDSQHRPKSFRWPTGDPQYPSGAISFDLSPPPSPQLSPSKDRWSFLSSFKNEPEAPPKADPPRPVSALSDWFQGESAPISLGLLGNPASEKREDTAMDMRPSFLKRSSTLTGGHSRSPTKSLTSPSSGRFSFLTSAARALSSGVVAAAPAPQEDDEKDEFLQLDVRAALQSHGDADPFSPSSFKDLLQDAEGLLTRMQLAYQQRVTAVADARAEVSAQKEENDETHIRAQHLKQQLNDLSAQNAEKDAVINDLLAELKAEKQLRQEELAAKVRSVRVVDPPPKKARGSRQSTDSSVVSDSGFESNNDDEDQASSLASSPSLSSMASSPHLGHARQASMTRASPTVVHNVSGPKLDSVGPHHSVVDDGTEVAGAGPGLAVVGDSPDRSGCSNCGGQNSNTAWEVVANLRTENHVLKVRNKHLEAEVEAVLGMVNGLLGT